MPISEFQLQEMLRRTNTASLDNATPSTHKGAAIQESALHDEIVDYCKARGWIVFHARMDCRTTYPLGTPDFIIATDDGRTLYIEAKARGGKLRPSQQAMLHWLERNKQIVAVVYSLEDFIAVSKLP